MERRGVAGADENAGADDAADAEEDQVPRAQRPLELARTGFFLDIGDALAQPDSAPKTPLRCCSRHSISPRGWFASEPSGSDGGRNPLAAQRLTRQHRSQWLAAENVDMEVRHFLARPLADVGQQAVTLDHHPRFAGDMADGADETGHLGVAGAFREIVPRHVRSLGDHQDVDRRQRIYVVEGERVLVLIDLLAGQLAAEDFREHVAVVIRLRRVDRHAFDCRGETAHVKAIVPRWTRTARLTRLTANAAS